MVDASYGTGPSNSSVSKYQMSGLTLFSGGNTLISGATLSLYPSQPCFYNTVISGTGSNPQQFISGIQTANTPNSESSWNV